MQGWLNVRRTPIIVRIGQHARNMNKLRDSNMCVASPSRNERRGILFTNCRNLMGNCQTSRFYVKNTLNTPKSESEDVEEIMTNKSMKILSAKVTSLRVDVVLKAALQMSRNKTESDFYESKIRVNGQKVYKKSALVEEGDEVDVVRGPSPINADFLLVSRVEVAEVLEDDDGYLVKFRRFKTLSIEKYDDYSNHKS